MTIERWFEDVEPGMELPASRLAVDPVQMFFFSAATFNGHRIHYDRTWATEVEGYGDLVVHGPLQAALLVRTVTDWIGGGGRLLEFSTQNRGAALLPDQLRFTGRVVRTREKDGQHLVDIELAGQKMDGDEAKTIMPASATVALPEPGR
ncbi:MaoC/PaaZ C-terminal domain-containing protein [Dactylosporangium sp. NPDC000555]|uniref:MaoC/PaaZ C-terminal domain-containing protein n=1 Tax=Dactylosporangium sp. NPDC000555 TaxID=3154260 RepID=UPI00331B3857